MFQQKVVAIEQENASLSHKLQQATDFRTTLQGKLELEHASLIQVTKERDDKEIVIQSLNEKMEELKAEVLHFDFSIRRQLVEMIL